MQDTDEHSSRETKARAGVPQHTDLPIPETCKALPILTPHYQAWLHPPSPLGPAFNSGQLLVGAISDGARRSDKWGKGTYEPQ